jgi:hypothetical protein
MKKQLRSRAPWLAILALLLLAAPAFAQVPQDTTFTGRLADDMGNPLTGPVDLELRIFDALTEGTQWYSEEHLAVPLDATGGFSVQLGQGTSVDTYDALLFADADRWLEVVVGIEVLTPRQIIGAVPWALIAQQANEIVPDPNAPRFEDCGDGTVADHRTGLQWEKKTGTVVEPWVNCEPGTCPDPHDVNNRYTWSETGSDPDGEVFSDFLTKLNDLEDPGSGCFASHCDWRLPIIGELRTITIGPEAGPGQATTCPASPCIDPDFAAVGGPTWRTNHWSDSTSPWGSDAAYLVTFANGNVSVDPKWRDAFVRAVRTGSCN